jgi:dual specificity phosphatase 12
MWSKRHSAAEAIDIVRRSKAVPLSASIGFYLTLWTAREQIWINESFQRQLSLFELCRYAPSMEEGIYVRWRQSLNQQRS